MASKHEMVYILSEDYWGFDPSTRDDALNFYTNVWTLPKSQYDSMTDEDDRRKLYRCALFYVVDKTDNHGFTPLAIQSQGNTVIVAATAAGGGINRRKYDSGAESEYETGSIIMRQADSKATTFDELQNMSTSTPGKFKIEEFIFDNETAIKSKVEELQEELGQINAAESYASESVPADVALDVSQPLAANPTTAAIAGADLITDVQDTSLNLFAEETMNLPNSNLPGLPVVANDFGESSALTSGNSVPQWYGADGELSAADKMAIKRKRIMESKMRGINRRNARKDKMEQMSAEMVNDISFEQVGGQDALGVGLPVIANDFGEDSAGGSGHGVPQQYGAETEMSQLMTSNAVGQAGVDYDHEIHYRADELSAEDFPGLHAAEQTMSLSPALPGLPVVPNDFGESSALTSGNSVPQWYGAEGRDSAANFIYDRDNKLEEKIRELKEMVRDEQESILGYNDAKDRLHSSIIEYEKTMKEAGKNPHQTSFWQSKLRSMDEINHNIEKIENQIDNYDYQIDELEDQREGLSQVNLGAEGGRKYGKRQRFDHIKGNSRYLARNAKGQWISNVGVSGSIKADLRSSAKSQQPVGFRGLGDADVRQAEGTMSDEEVIAILTEVEKSDKGVYNKYPVGQVRMAMSLVNQRPSLKAWAQKTYSAEAAPSVVDAAEPLEYIPYEFADEMDVGEYISSDDFMVLLAETVDGMALRYKPPMYRSPLAMAGAGAILAVVGMKLLKK